MKKQIEQTFKNKNFPEEMRRQLWPLCCGASILSGFKKVHELSEEELTEQILYTIDNQLPDFQVYAGETIFPRLTFLTLNMEQMGSEKIMNAITKAGFVKFAEGKPRNYPQGFFVRDTTKSFRTVA